MYFLIIIKTNLLTLFRWTRLLTVSVITTFSLMIRKFKLLLPNHIAKNLIFSLGFIQAAINNISMVSMLFLLSGPTERLFIRLVSEFEIKTIIKIYLAIEFLLKAKKRFHLKPNYVLMDSFYPAAKLLRTGHKLKRHWISKI